MSDRYLIWSHEHGSWWRPGRAGYTRRLADAGRYSRDHALAICANSREGWEPDSPPDEIPVREEDALACRDRFVAAMRGIASEEPGR